MIFKRYPRYQFHDTPRARAVYSRRMDRRVLQAGFFAAEVRANVLPVDTEFERRRALFEKTEARFRQHEAATWLKGRRDFYAMPHELREEFRWMWASFGGPKTSVYFCDVLLSFRREKGLAPMPDLWWMRPADTMEDEPEQPALLEVQP